MPISDGLKSYSTNGSASGNVWSTYDPDGTVMFGAAGEDVMRGGKYDDIITGGSGNDLLWGGGGADQFRFFGNQIEGASDTDKIFDLNFSEGDSIVLSGFGINFHDHAGANAFHGGADVQISGWYGLAAAIADSNGAITFSQKGSTNVLILDILNADTNQHQFIHITGGYDALVGVLLA